MNNLKHLQTFKNSLLSFSLLRTGIRHSALARRHAKLLSVSDNAAMPLDFCVSFPPFQSVPDVLGAAVWLSWCNHCSQSQGCSHSGQGDRSTPCARDSPAGPKLGKDKTRGQDTGDNVSIAFICWSLQHLIFHFSNAESEMVHRGRGYCSP